MSRWRAVTERIREYYERTYLLVTNSGPRREGYTYCTRCGLIEPTAVPSVRLSGPTASRSRSSRARLSRRRNDPRTRPRHRLHLRCVVGIAERGTATDPQTWPPGDRRSPTNAFRGADDGGDDETRSRAGRTAGETGLRSRRRVVTASEAEIYLYDTLAGGAGFSRRISDLGRTVFDDALTLLESCPETCDRSCYRCLRSFKNRFEHDLLDRHLGASLLRYLLDGTPPTLAEARTRVAADRVFEDLTRLDVDGVRFARTVEVEFAGVGPVEAPILAETSTRRWIVGIHGPLTPDEPATRAARSQRVRRRNARAATRRDRHRAQPAASHSSGHRRSQLAMTTMDTFDTRVEAADGQWPTPPKWMSYSSLNEAELCPRRWALRRATYPEIWAAPAIQTCPHCPRSSATLPITPSKRS